MSKRKKFATILAILVMLSLAVVVWLTSEFKKNDRLVGKLVATLPTEQHDYRWLDNNLLLCITPNYPGSQSRTDAVSRMQLIDVRTGSTDELLALNAWVQNREVNNNVKLLRSVENFSPDGKWVYAEEANFSKSGSYVSLGYTKRRWALSLDGTKQLSINSNERLTLWLPDSSGLIVTETEKSSPLKNGKYSGFGYVHSLVKLNNINKAVPLAVTSLDLGNNPVFSPNGKHIIEMAVRHRGEDGTLWIRVYSDCIFAPT